MWKKGRKRTDGDSAAQSSNKVAKTGPDEDGIVVCELSKNRRVSVRIWNGVITVDIREFYVKDGKQLPGKKGISLSLDQWKILREHNAEINKAVAGTL